MYQKIDEMQLNDEKGVIYSVAGTKSNNPISILRFINYIAHDIIRVLNSF